jgi:hypothetical protein
VLDELLHHPSCHVDWHREAGPDVAALGRQDGGIDADQAAVKRDQCPAGIPRID